MPHSEPDVLIKRLDPGVPLPSYAHPGDAGADLTTAEDVELGPGERALVRTGLAIALPDGYAAFVHPRSGLAARHGVTLVNAPGTVDAGYRGEIKVTLMNTDRDRPVSFRRGDRIAQLVIQRVERAVFHEVTVLPGSSRGDGGFGSTGRRGAVLAPGGRPPRIAALLGGTFPPSAPRPPRANREGACAVFRRRRSADAGRQWPGDSDQELSGDELDYDEPFDDQAEGQPAAAVQAEGGPWDAGEAFPAQERVDLGSLQVPVGPEHEIQLVMAEQHGAWVTVRYRESEVQIQAFAAARRSTLWDDVRAEIAAEVHTAGGRSQESEGSFGTELMAQVPMEPGQPASGMRLVRFVGIDGPRWFVRGLFTGPAADGGEQAELLEDVLRNVVVVRGEHPVPPREILELRLPPEARQALEEQAAAEEENRFRGDLNPFDRGPEFTETR